MNERIQARPAKESSGQDEEREVRSAGSPATENERLLQFINWVTPLVFGFAILTLGAYAAFDDTSASVATIIFTLYGAALLYARLNLMRGKIELAVLTICVGLLVAALAMSVVYPEWIPVLVITPLLAVAVALPYTRGKSLLRLILFTWFIAVVIATTSRLQLRPSGLPEWFMNAFTVSAVGAAVAVVLLLLWQFSSRLNDNLSITRAAEERYALAERGVNDGLWDWNLESGSIYYSPRWKRMIGEPEHRIADSPDEWFTRVHEEDAERLQEELRNHFASGRGHLEVEYRMRHRDGRYLWMLCRGLAVRDDSGKAVRIAGSQSDITRRKQAEERLIHDAFHDSLTGLANREMFLTRLGTLIERARKPRPGGSNNGGGFALLYIDLDNFKAINDSLGHEMGDRLLVDVSERLKDSVRPRDIIARLGGDEFTILMDDVTEVSEAELVADRLLMQLQAPFMIEGYELFTTASMGIVLDDGEYTRPEEPLRDADTAMYRAKALGRSRTGVFESTMHSRAVALFRLETELRRAMERDEFMVHYQPIASLTSGRIVGFEALMRWQHPERGLIMPGEFVPVAEDTGLILNLEFFVLREACHQISLWQNRFPEHQPLNINVNLSRNQLARPELLEKIAEIIEETSIDPRSLRIEITESILMQNADLATVTLSRLRQMDVQVHIDDFGTGYSSLSALHSFPIDALKVDQSFVARMHSGDESEIVQTIITLAHNLGLDVTAEGIEEESQLEALQGMGCDFGQGYLFARPLDKDGAEGLLEENRRW